VNQRQEVIVLLTPQILDDSAGSSFGYLHQDQMHVNATGTAAGFTDSRQ